MGLQVKLSQLCFTYIVWFDLLLLKLLSVITKLRYIDNFDLLGFSFVTPPYMNTYNGHNKLLPLSDPSEIATSIGTSHIRMDDLSTLGIFPSWSDWNETSDDRSADVVQLALDAAGAFLASPSSTNASDDAEASFSTIQSCIFANGMDGLQQTDGTVEENTNG